MSDSDPDSKRSGTKGCLWTVGVLVITLLLLVASLATIFLVREGQDRKLLQVKVDELTRRGAPIDNASLDAAYQAKTDPTDAPAWNQIFAELESNEFKTWSQGVGIFDSKADGAGWTESAWPGEAAERNLVAKTEDLRHRIYQLVRKPAAVRFVKSFDGFDTLLPHVQQQRQVLRLIATEFQVAFADRDSRACREAIDTCLCIAQLSREEPFLVAQLVNVACHGIAMQNIVRAVEYDVLLEQDLEAVLKRMSEDELSVQRLEWMVQGERAGALEVAKSPGKYSESLGPSMNVYSKLGGPSHRDILNLLELFENLENLDKSDIDAFRVQATQLSNALETRSRNVGILDMRDWIFTMMVAPAAEAIVEALVRDIVRERFTRHAIAIRLYEKRVGHLPENLDALQEIGFDSQRWKPWGGQPFGYRVQAGEGILWATIPQKGSVTSADPPEIVEGSIDGELEKMFYLRLRKAAK